MLPLENLDVKNPSRDSEYWKDLEALYAGGKAFHARATRFLPQNPLEIPSIYEVRIREAVYKAYFGSIVDFYIAWLFSGDFTVRSKSKEDNQTIPAPEFYADFREDVGSGKDLKTFLRDRFRQALVQGRTHWICQLKDDSQEYPATLAAFNDLGPVSLIAIEPEDVWDWECDETGRYLWCSVHALREERLSIAVKTRTIVESWKIYDREKITVYELRYEKGKRPQSKTFIAPKSETRHGFNGVPICTLDLPSALWLGNRLHDPQVGYFRQTAALDWSTKRTCYAMPVFNLEDQENPPIYGAGYAMYIGVDEKMGWTAPPSDHMQFQLRLIDGLRNDIFRISQQMAMGLDNNAETVGRSADSKEQDNSATRIVLGAFGAVIMHYIEQTYEMISSARGENDIAWSIEGFSGYDTAAVGEVLDQVTRAQMLNIPSKTLLKVIKTKAAHAIAVDSSQDVKDIIAKEISEGVDAAAPEIDEMSSETALMSLALLQRKLDGGEETTADLEEADSGSGAATASKK